MAMKSLFKKISKVFSGGRKTMKKKKAKRSKPGKAAKKVAKKKTVKKKTKVKQMKKAVNKKERYVIFRTYSAGVFAGVFVSRKGKEGVLKNARRLWQWAGAASLSQLAMEGTKNTAECKFPCVVDRVELTEIIEILDCTDAARKSIELVPVWKM